MADPNNPIINLLREQGRLDDLQIEEVVQENAKSGKPVQQIIADAGYVSMPDILRVIADHLGTEVVEISEADLTKEIIESISGETARMYQCVPVAVYGSTVQVAFADPMNPEVVDQTAFATGKEIMPVVADPAQIQAILGKIYPDSMAGAGFADILKELGEDKLKEAVGTSKDDLPDVTKLADATPIVKFVNLVLFQAVNDRASDIHFEPFEDEYKIRYRVDGALYEMAPPPKHLSGPIASRLKIMANLNISERRLPQDGRISLNMGGKQIDFRMSTLPTQFGESVGCPFLNLPPLTLILKQLVLPSNFTNTLRKQSSSRTEFSW